MAESRIRGRENSSLDDICAQRECLPDKNLVFFLASMATRWRALEKSFAMQE
jgi:hypothetical protein